MLVCILLPACSPRVQDVQAPEEELARAGPGWQVWRAFHESHARNPGILASSAGSLSSADQDLILGLGKDWLETVAQVESADRQQVSDHYGFKPPPPEILRALEEARAREQAGEPPAVVLSPEQRARVLEAFAQARSGPTLQSAMERDGLAAQMQQRRDALVAGHQDRLREALGTAKYNAVLDWIDANITPNVGTYEVPIPLPPPGGWVGWSDEERPAGAR